MTLNIELLESSFDKIRPQALEFSAYFYQALFEHYPELNKMFKEVDQAAMEKKLIASLALIVENLRNPIELTSALKSLGARHVKIGTVPEHYPMIGNILIYTFSQYLGEDWTLELATAWEEAYNLIADLMLSGAETPEKYLNGELTFYEWLDLYGESSPKVRDMISSTTHFHYRT
jgi:hemoglobin-like flavoprotein